MKSPSEFRRWINRDDGRFYQIGNESISTWIAVGTIFLVGALVLWQLHTRFGINGAWAVVASLAGLVSLILGARVDSTRNGT